MEIQGSSFPGKSQPLKSKTNRKTIQSPKANVKDPPVYRQRRVFGTSRNPNAPSKAVADKPLMKKPSIDVSPKQFRPTRNTTTAAATGASERKSPEKNRAAGLKEKKKKKSVGLTEQVGKSVTGVLAEGAVISLGTPVVGSSSAAEDLGTPYQSAARCSKCRFDKLETASYWLSQIKLAETVGKHFVSAAFFRLALESKAEPMGSLRAELRRYVARHEYLSTQAHWQDVSVSYGFIKNLKEPSMEQSQT